jgi:lysyl-tRNA synthetase class 2
MSDFRPTTDWAVLKHRAVMLRRTREFFDARGFTEVETPILSADTVIDRHLDPPVVENIGCLSDKPGSPRRMFLQTSPEFAMKRLLAAGAGAIYQIAHAFRFGERGPRHNPEFTIVEWYRPGDDYQAGMKLLGELCHTLLARKPVEPLTYREAFRRYVEIDPHAAPLPELIAVAETRTPQGAAALRGVTDRDAWLDLLLVELVEPQLGRPAPTILCDYPASQAALARLRDGDPPVAERFELYCDGVELANGYHELLEAETLAQRNAESNRLRAADGKPPLPEQSRLLEAMRHGLPACTGCALGFDRVVMLACGKTRIEDVLPFPIERA